MDKKITWKGYEWLLQEAWGNIHPEFTYKWYDPSCVIVDNDSLKLLTKYNPKKFEINGINIISETGIGLISCQYPFHFGIYDIEAKLPEGSNLWPAIWLWDKNKEIDIMEAYSNDKGSYFRCGWDFWKLWKIQNNFHYKNNNINTHIGARNMFVGFNNPTSGFIKYRMEWTSEFIKISINGKVRRIFKGDTMKYFQRSTQFVINNGVKDTHKVGSPVSIFEIKDFKYTKYE